MSNQIRRKSTLTNLPTLEKIKQSPFKKYEAKRKKTDLGILSVIKESKMISIQIEHSEGKSERKKYSKDQKNPLKQKLEYINSEEDEQNFLPELLTP